MSRKTGTVKFFSVTKGFGFIQPNDSNKDVFVDNKAIQSSGLQGLKENDRVSFEIVQDARTGKESATNLTLE
jgi:cold shock protein